MSKKDFLIGLLDDSIRDLRGAQKIILNVLTTIKDTRERQLQNLKTNNEVVITKKHDGFSVTFPGNLLALSEKAKKTPGNRPKKYKEVCETLNLCLAKEGVPYIIEKEPRAKNGNYTFAIKKAAKDPSDSKGFTIKGGELDLDFIQNAILRSDRMSVVNASGSFFSDYQWIVEAALKKKRTEMYLELFFSDLTSDLVQKFHLASHNMYSPSHGSLYEYWKDLAEIQIRAIEFLQRKEFKLALDLRVHAYIQRSFILQTRKYHCWRPYNFSGTTNGPCFYITKKSSLLEHLNYELLWLRREKYVRKTDVSHYLQRLKNILKNEAYTMLIQEFKSARSKFQAQKT